MMYTKFGCAILFFEVGRLSTKGGHAHVQAVPIPLRLKDKIEEAFLREGRAQGIDFEEDSDAAMASCANGRGSYFKVDLPDGRKMIHLLKDHIPFSIQFGRYGNFHLTVVIFRSTLRTQTSIGRPFWHAQPLGLEGLHVVGRGR